MPDASRRHSSCLLTKMDGRRHALRFCLSNVCHGSMSEGCGGLVVGILIGLISVPVAGVPLSLGSAGALLSGLAFGWLRSRRPTFGEFPPAASQILKDLGLAVYIAAIGLTSATGVLALLKTRGWELPIAAIFVSLVPTLASVYVGRFLLHIERFCRYLFLFFHASAFALEIGADNSPHFSKYGRTNSLCRSPNR
jgi:AspT/YidE/YbjL antiporter-like protein